MTRLRLVGNATLAVMFAAASFATADGRENIASYFDLSDAESVQVAQNTTASPARLVGQTSLVEEFNQQVCFNTPGCCDDACGTGCCDDIACGNACCDAPGCVIPELLLGCFCPTPHCFDDWISPMTNPVFFEDPRTLTELRAIFLQHKVPLAAGGGDVQLYALQIRAALTDRLSLIATKDGYAVSSNPLIRDGWADVSLGLKYNLIRDYKTESLLTTGFTYEMPVGSPRTLQGNGDGEFHLFVTGGTELCCDWHYLSAFGLRLPVDDDAEESSLYWSNHIDYHFGHGFYALTEFNWFHWTESGSATNLGVSGGDLFNLGAQGVAGNDIVTGAFGVKYKPNRLTEIGVAWENPLTERRDVLENRLTVDLILRY
ncbi:hypothetical protein [Aeoliella mucimassa]|uniref:MetA-pathway of phenol degradation n=1 Tax=Aeoliella mucimassa TaxID=2527972 RepID=A0A518AM04_9BACT|nr:hypothetical protein [Aeoliella mucimassa]QDU55760.1 hypothetical protein Pan181_19550 [Aeoliella mucimassa]